MLYWNSCSASTSGVKCGLSWLELGLMCDWVFYLCGFILLALHANVSSSVVFVFVVSFCVSIMLTTWVSAALGFLRCEGIIF